MKAPWLEFLAAAVLMLASGALFHFGVNIWVAIAFGWFGFGVFCYFFFLGFCQPMPLVIKEKELPLGPEQPPKPFSIRDILGMVLTLIPIAILAPVWLIFVAWDVKNRIFVRSKWRQKFPNSTKKEIREFFDTMVSAFLGEPLGLPYRYSPDSKLLEIYRGFYGPGELPDKEEVSKFAQALKKRYNVDFVSLLREDMTVGELYALAKTGNST